MSGGKNEINNCSNKGRITFDVNSGYTCAGGILGSSKCVELRMNGCFNTGEITNGSTVGGIIGATTDTKRTDICFCYNTGNVVADAGKAGNGTSGGGIIAADGIATSCNVSCCYNAGKISASMWVGGILGYTVSGKINNCYNLGEVVANYNGGGPPGAGGICGFTPIGEIKNCYNAGDVSFLNSSMNCAGGIEGWQGGHFNNCYCLKTVFITGGNKTGDGTFISDEEMRNQEFCNMLNEITSEGERDKDDVWEHRENRYPCLCAEIPTDLVDSTELEVENTIKKFEITTEVAQNESGDITGKGQAPFKTVEYNKSYDEKYEGYEEIEMTPSEGYGIVSVTINGEKIDYEKKGDKYTIPTKYLENIKEDKHIVVTYAKLENILTIKKVDASDKKALAGATFKIEKKNSKLSESPGKSDDTDDETTEESEKLYTTNVYGEIKVKLAEGEYTVTEVKAPEGYTLDNEPKTIEIPSTDEKENVVTFENKKQPVITVHHYYKESDGTTTKNMVAPDDIYQGDVGTQYATRPHINLKDFTLEKDKDGKNVIPKDASGKYKEDAIEVTYYYQVNPINLTIHHYLEGTENKIADDEFISTPAEVTFDKDNNYTINTDASYTLNSNEQYEKLLADYELSRIETSVQGSAEITETLNYSNNSEVKYYYTLKKHNITTEVQSHTENRTNKVTNEREITEVKGGKVSAKYTDEKSIEGDDKQFVETVKQKENSTAEITATPDEGYKVSKIKLISTADDETETEITIYDETIAKDKEDDESKDGEADGESKEPDGTGDTNPGTDGSDEGDEGDKADESKKNSDDKISYEIDENGAITLKGASEDTKKVFEDVTENKHIVVEFAPILGKVVVHHYIVGTGEEHENSPQYPVLKDGVTQVTDEIKEDYVGENYATKANENINKRYKLVSTSEKTSGEYGKDVTHVYYYYDYDNFAYTVKYYYDGVPDPDKTVTYDGENKKRFGTVISEYPDKSEGYVFDKIVPADGEDSTKAHLTITESEEENTIYVYYVTLYKITTDVAEHEEKYSDGHTETVKGGTITIKDAENEEDEGKSEEEVVRGKDTKGDIVIVPEEGYEIARVTITDRDGESDLDIKSFVEEDGTITLNAENGFFTNVTSSKHIEVEFRKKTKVTVKYLVKDTNESVSEKIKDVIINGLEGEKYSTERKTVTNYRPAEVELADGNFASETFEKTETDGTFTYTKYDENTDNRMFADEVTIIYWYEKIPEGKVIVRHIEIDENDIRKGLTMDSGIELKVEVQSIEEIISKAKMEASKKLNTNNGTQNKSKESPESTQNSENESSKGAQSNGTTGSKEKGDSAEKSENGATKETQNGGNSEGVAEDIEGKGINGAEINGEKVSDDGSENTNGGEPISANEIANKGTQEIANNKENSQEGSTNEGDQANSGTEENNQDTEEGDGNAQGSQSANANETSKDETQDGSNEDENELGNESNQNPANGSANSTIVDNENGESTKEEYTGLVETTQATARRTFTDKETGRDYASVDGPVSNDEDIIVVGKDENEYLAKIVEKDDDGDGQIDTVEVRYYYIRQYKVTTEVKLHEEVIDGVETMVKGGNIEISGLGAEELVNRMGSNSKQIIATPDRKYKVKSITINGELINIEDLRDENGIVRLGEKYLNNITEDKNIVVEYEKMPGKVVVKYLEDGTDKELSKEVEINGISDDKYKAYPKAIDGYELVMEKYPQNEEGTIAPEDTIVVYYYRAIPQEPDEMPENPEHLQNTQGGSSNRRPSGTSNGATSIKTGDKVIFSVLTIIIAGAIILVIKIGKIRAGRHTK